MEAVIRFALGLLSSALGVCGTLFFQGFGVATDFRLQFWRGLGAP